MSVQLIHLIVKMAEDPNGISPAPLAQFQERVDLGELVTAIDPITGFNGLQLAIKHARNPSMALLLLHPSYDPDLRFCRRDPDTLLIDEQSTPLLLTCRLVQEPRKETLPEDETVEREAADVRRHGIDGPAVERALTFVKLFPRIVECQLASLSVLRDTTRVRNAVEAAMQTLATCYMADKNFANAETLTALHDAYDSFIGRQH